MFNRDEFEAGKRRNADEGSLIWNDGEVKIDWPIKDPIISERDARHCALLAL
jgi:dTDP-4-dehydrorhamnose 3,5-epimerase